MTAPVPSPSLVPRHAGRRLLVSLIIVVAMLAATIAWVVGTDSGTRTVWHVAVWAMQGKLSGIYDGGKLATGIRLRELRYHDATLQLDIDRIDSSWQLSLAQRHLAVSFLRIGVIDIRQSATPTTPMHLPATLRLPLSSSLRLNDISLQKLRLQRGLSVTELSDLQLHGTSDGMQHTLVLDQLRTAYGQATARLHLNGKQPFALRGEMALTGQTPQAGRKFQIAAQLSGSLTELGIALTASGDKLGGTAAIVAAPFAAVPLQQASIDLQHLNPRAFNSKAPTADIRVQAHLSPLAGKAADPLRVSGSVSISNALPGRIDQQRLPLRHATARVDLGIDSQQLSDLRISLLDKAGITGQGQFRRADNSGNFAFQIADLDLHALHQQLKPTALRGPLRITLRSDAQHLLLQLQDAFYTVQADASITTGKLNLHSFQLSAAKARLDLSGTLATGGAMDYAFKGQLDNVDPALWMHTGMPAHEKNKAKKNASAAVPARINMDFDASGSLSPTLQARLNFNIHDSSYAGLPMRGHGKLQLAGQRLLPGSVELLVAGNRLQLTGALGAPGDRLDVHLDAPQLARLGFGLAGSLRFDGQLSGARHADLPANLPANLRTSLPTNLRATYSGGQLSFGPHHLNQFAGQADLQIDLAGRVCAASNRLQWQLDANGYSGPNATLKQLNLTLSGTCGQHQLVVRADGRVKNQTLALQLRAHGKLTEEQGKNSWNGVIDQLDNHGLPRLALAAPLSLKLGADSIVAGATRLHIDRMAIDLKSLSYQQGRLHSQGSASALDLGRMLALAQEMTGTPAPVKTDLVLDAQWNFGVAETASGFLHLTRKSGDIAFDTGNAMATVGTLGLSALQLRIDLSHQEARLNGRIATHRIGTLEAHGQIGLQKRDGILTLTPDSPLQAQARFQMPEVKNMVALLGPQYSLNGTLAMTLNAAGTLARPRLSGTIDGDDLAVTLFDQGIQLKDGIVRIVMDDNLIDLRQLTFHGGAGTLRATGKAQLGSGYPTLDATIIADHLQLFASPNRQLMLSGQARLANDNGQHRIDGKFIVDRALFDLPKNSAPTLGDDVVILRRKNHAGTKTGAAVATTLTTAAEKPAGGLIPVAHLQIGLGDNFRFSGSGADLRLRGDIDVRSEPALRATGTIHVVKGTYEAFGVKLDIERGIIDFQGPINNPGLNILAMRRHQEVEAGVEVTGNANQPRVRLVSEPNVPDDEKLSWMLLGHGNDDGKISLDQRKLGSQALALIGNFGGKKIARDIGLDQFSIGTSESGLGDVQVVHLGKAISEKLSVGYEQSLSGAASVAKAAWQLSQHWSLVARTGTINGLNILYNHRFD